MKVTYRITGADKLTAVFGGWPSFHDSEVLWIKLDRRRDNGAQGATLDAMIHLFEMTSNVGADGFYLNRHHTVVHLRFQNVIELQMVGFNSQNVLCDLQFTDLQDLQDQQILFSVDFVSSYGVHASFHCEAIEVISVVQFNESGETVSN